jgi:hypothetical protein
MVTYSLPASAPQQLLQDKGVHLLLHLSALTLETTDTFLSPLGTHVELIEQVTKRREKEKEKEKKREREEEIYIVSNQKTHT